MAVSLSTGGSEAGSASTSGRDATTGKEMGDVIPRVNGGIAGVQRGVERGGDGALRIHALSPRGRAGKPGRSRLLPTGLFLHTLGTPVDKDTYVLGKDFPRIAEVGLRTTDDGKLVLAKVANGDGGEFAYYVAALGLAPAKTWTKVADFADGVVQARFGPEGALYLLSQKAAPRRRVLRVDPMHPQAAPKEVIPQGNAVISDFSVTKTKLYTIDVVGGPSQMRVFTLDPAGGPAKLPVTLPILAVSTVSQIARLTGDDILFENESFVSPSAWYRYTPGGDGILPTALRRVTQIDFSDAEVVRETCTSKDGTKVPMTLVRKKGTKLDGSSPTLLTGYGGYSINETPWFRVENRLWLDLGGVFADADIRGGGEWGEEWHSGGKLVNKQNVFDDLYACAQTLVHEGATRPDKLAIEGGSNGGLLMGAELTQHPDAYRAVVSHVGIYDMLRVELTPNGAFKRDRVRHREGSR